MLFIQTKRSLGWTDRFLSHGISFIFHFIICYLLHSYLIYTYNFFILFYLLFILRYKDEFIPRVLEDRKLSGRTGKVILILDNAPTHPPLEEINSVNENFEVVYLPANVTALIQPLDQGLIAITKNL